MLSSLDKWRSVCSENSVWLIVGSTSVSLSQRRAPRLPTTPLPKVSDHSECEWSLTSNRNRRTKRASFAPPGNVISTLVYHQHPRPISQPSPPPLPKTAHLQ